MSRVTHEEPPEGADQRGRPSRPGRPSPHQATASGDGTGNGTGPLPAAHDDPLTARLARIEALLIPARSEFVMAERRLTPAWRRATRGEARWASSSAVAAVMAIQLLLPERLAVHPRLLMPAVEFALLLCLIALNPHRIERVSRTYRALSLALTLAIGGANAYSAVRLVSGLVEGTEKAPAGTLLLTGGAIWLTNVVIFALGYWELDRGGPAARARGEIDVPDFLYVQMQSPELAPAHWEPTFFDYFYLSFTNSTAFSPTDVMPVTRRAKALMLVQSAVSLITVVLVVARAVNILD
jgi:uncharacterized membrane protein